LQENLIFRSEKKEMKELKIGDRVAAYCISRSTGVVEKISDEGSLTIRLDRLPQGTVYVHPKQCRLLKKIEPRRRFWINVYVKHPILQERILEYARPSLSKETADHWADSGRIECIEVVEVRKKK
jgi:hypothetical protein